MRVQAVTAVWAAMLIMAPVTSAQEWDGQLTGLDGVTIACSNANKEAYAARICEELSGFAQAEFEQAGIAVADLGSWDAHDGEEPAKPDTMATPLKVTIFVRGTHSSGITGLNLRSRLSVDYDKAVEASSSADAGGRRGELVLWETSTTGSGPEAGLVPAIIQAGWKKLAEQLRAVAAAWPATR